MKNLIYSVVILISVFSARTSFAQASQAEKLRMYQASSETFDGYIRTSRFGVAGNTRVLMQKQLVDGLIATVALAKDCSQLQSLAPTLRAGYYNLYPGRDINKPTLTYCEPINLAQLLLILNGDD
jgi:hypothetical protein